MSNTASGSKVTRVYSNFRGVDFRGEEINLMRSPDSLNMWKDYKETDSIRTRPALEKMTFGSWEALGNKINGIFHYNEYYVIHNGTKLISDGVMGGSGNIPIADVKDAKSSSFIYDSKMYFKDGDEYYVIDWLFDVSKVEGYVPTTTIGKKPSGGGTVLEDVNLLTGKRINTFLADGESKEYYLDAQNIDSVDIVMVNGEVISSDKYTVTADKGLVEFTEAPSSPLTDGQDNVSIEFTKTIKGYREKITKCTLLEVFDNRVFFSGNPDYPNHVWHCSLDNPAYCSDKDCYIEGLDTARVTGLVAGNNALWVFKEPSQSNTSIYYHTPTIDAEYGKVYPNTHSNISLGCVGGAINFNDDIIFFSQRGMEGIHSDITTERAVAHRSSLIDRKLLVEENYKDMVLIEWEGYLVCFVGNKVYLADSRATFTNENHYEYEWFYWELDKKVTCADVYNGELYIGTEMVVGEELCIYKFTDTTSAVESYWVTPKDKFKYPQYMKTTNKRGCVVESTGDVSVYAKTNKTDFELINNYENITDAFVCRIKRKKFKDIQLKFSSATRFSLETATLECYIGGYIKR